MENHPIPQDITGFQFKLIGEMTVKQFGYVVGGVIPAWIFIFVLPWPFILRAPIGLIFIALGLGLAFVPLSGRPMDTLLFAFILSLFKPNQYVYAKSNSILDPLFLNTPHLKVKGQTKSIPLPKYTKDELTTFIQNTAHTTNKWDKKELEYIKSLSLNTSPQTMSITPEPDSSIVLPKPNILQTEVPHIISVSTQAKTLNPPSMAVDIDQNLQKNINSVTNINTNQNISNNNIVGKLEIEKAEKASEENSILAKNAHDKVLELEKTLSNTAMQKQQLEQELQSLKKQMNTPGKQAFIPSIAEEKLQQTQNVKMLPQNMTKSSGIPMASEAPNLLLGIARDARDNPLPNILIEVKDKEGNPVRAFKTNMLGNFASATPLQNGIYTIEFEDPKGLNKFDTIQIEAKGEIVMPLVVSSTDAREELRKSLFGGTPSN